MDGVGIGRGDAADAVALARTPTLDRFAQEALATKLRAHGTAVGLPSDDDMGNSEVGHNALGAGRIFDQGAKLVANAIADGRLFAGEVWQQMIERCLKRKTPLHFIGLLSDGNVHSNIKHLLAMLDEADKRGVEEARVHALLDGRDVPKTSALTYVDELESLLERINAKPGRNYRIASGGGRMVITMDRYEADWPMVERGWHTHVLGEGRRFASTREAIETLRREHPGVVDQELPPFVIADQKGALGPIEDGASVVAFNFRGDRMLELVRAFEDDAFDKFERVRRPDVLFAGMMLYDGDTQRPRHYLVAPPTIRCTFGELCANAALLQLAISETQKFGHVTYFYNGNRSGAFDAAVERYIEIPSLAPPFEAHPEMRAEQIADALVAELAAHPYRLVRVNFANGDMVGHTGNLEATIAAVEAVDAAIDEVSRAVLARGGALVVTADHGNADDMAERNKKTGELLRDESGALVPKTSHSLNPVPFYVVLAEADRNSFELSNVEDPGLGNVAATLATLLGFAVPEGYLPSIVKPRS